MLHVRGYWCFIGDSVLLLQVSVLVCYRECVGVL